MELLLSNIHPLRYRKRNAACCFEELIQLSDTVKIATGYISANALVEIKKTIEDNQGPHLELMIGMHGLEGFTHPQHESAKLLDDYLQNQNLGSVRVCSTFKYHGKIYTFQKNSNTFAGMIGSSNLNSMFDAENVYESDLYINDPKIIASLDEFVTDFSEKACIPFGEHKPRFIENQNLLLENHQGVEKIAFETYVEALNNRTDIKFDIPVKASVDAQKSNLNAFFGKGRKNQQGHIRPRPWYEVELIVPRTISGQKGYPPKETLITVITDDLWKFNCKISGDFSKNFRSAEDLKILGRWIKGRLENKGSLKIGHPVTEETLRHYGRNCITLTATQNPHLWLLDFKP